MIEKQKQFGKAWRKWEKIITNSGAPVHNAPYYHFVAGFRSGWKSKPKAISNEALLKDMLRWYLWLVRKNGLDKDVPSEIRIGVMVGLGVCKIDSYFKNRCKNCGQKLLTKTARLQNQASAQQAAIQNGGKQ